MKVKQGKDGRWCASVSFKKRMLVADGASRKEAMEGCIQMMLDAMAKFGGGYDR